VLLPVAEHYEIGTKEEVFFLFLFFFLDEVHLKTEKLFISASSLGTAVFFSSFFVE